MKKILLTGVVIIFAIAGVANNKLTRYSPAFSGKILFSNSPFTGSSSAGKSNFTSNEFIYGRIELSGSSIKEAFKLQEAYGHYYLVCDVEVWQDGNSMGAVTHNYILVDPDNLDKSWLNLDILPEPARASTLYSMTEEFDAGYGYFPFYNAINPRAFPSGGTYQVKVKIFSRSKNAWGAQEQMEKWPLIVDGFDFSFREEDIATIKNNSKTAIARMEENVANASRYDKLPPVFSSPGKLTDPGATTAKVSAILKRDLPGRAIIKFVAEQYNGAYWSIAKDDYGLPKYRYFNPHIWMAYKMDGKCYVGYVTLRQVYSGGGTYGPLEVAWTSTKDDKGIDCAKVK